MSERSRPCPSRHYDGDTGAYWPCQQQRLHTPPHTYALEWSDYLCQSCTVAPATLIVEATGAVLCGLCAPRDQRVRLLMTAED